jgi:hypothetical protein
MNKRTIVILIIVLVAGASVLFFIQNIGKTDIENIFIGKERTEEMSIMDWIGIYEYSELAPGTHGSNQTWDYKFKIYEKKNEIRSQLDIEGFQTFISAKVVIKERDEVLDVFFDSHLSKDSFASYEKGDLLFALERVSDEEYRILWNKMKSNLLEPGDARFKKIPIEKEDVFEIDERTEENDSIMAGSKGDGYYIGKLVDIYPTLLEEAINNSDLSSLKNFFGNEDVAKEHEKLIKILQEKGANFKVDDFLYYFDFDTLFQEQEIKIIFSYTNKYGEKEQVAFDYFFEFEEIRDEYGKGEPVIVKMRD